MLQVRVYYQEQCPLTKTSLSTPQLLHAFVHRVKKHVSELGQQTALSPTRVDVHVSRQPRLVQEALVADGALDVGDRAALGERVLLACVHRQAGLRDVRARAHAAREVAAGSVRAQVRRQPVGVRRAVAADAAAEVLDARRVLPTAVLDVLRHLPTRLQLRAVRTRHLFRPQWRLRRPQRHLFDRRRRLDAVRRGCVAVARCAERHRVVRLRRAQLYLQTHAGSKLTPLTHQR